LVNILIDMRMECPFLQIELYYHRREPFSYHGAVAGLFAVNKRVKSKATLFLPNCIAMDRPSRSEMPETLKALAVWEAFERCQRRFPTVHLPIEVYEVRINEILSSELEPADEASAVEAFARIHHEDLYLAIACSRNDRVAWEYFADDYAPLLRKFAAQACRNSNESEDLAQEITARLLGDNERMAGYNGRGSLAGWLRVAVSHAAIDRFRRTTRLTSLEELQERGSEAVLRNPEKKQGEETVDSRWGPALTGIAAECLRRLSARDRLMLGLYYLQNVSLKDLGRQFGIHEATASRWLERIRRDIRKQVERELRKKHGLRSAEMESLWKWVSPGSLAEAISGSLPGVETPPRDTGGQSQKKSAIGENSGVIEKEELQ
jgi:RNA polymerase sigma-70 factor